MSGDENPELAPADELAELVEETWRLLPELSSTK